MSDRGLFGYPQENIDDAAAAALLWLSHQPRAAQQEYMGLLMQDPDSKMYYRTPFQTEGKRAESSWTGVPDLPIAGVVHNHPTPTELSRVPNTEFSPADVRTAGQLGNLPSYVAASQKDGVWKDVKLSEERRTHRINGPVPQTAQTGVGQEFLAQYPIEDLKMIIASRIRNGKLSPGLKAKLLRTLLAP